MIDVIARTEGIALNTVQFKAVLGKGMSNTVLFVVKPKLCFSVSEFCVESNSFKVVFPMDCVDSLVLFH
jgi:hypothetical protein